MCVVKSFHCVTPAHPQQSVCTVYAQTVFAICLSCKTNSLNSFCFFGQIVSFGVNSKVGLSSLRFSYHAHKFQKEIDGDPQTSNINCYYLFYREEITCLLNKSYDTHYIYLRPVRWYQGIRLAIYFYC